MSGRVVAPPDWLADAHLAPLWSRVRDRLERSALQPQGRVVLRGMSRDERHAVGALLGRVLVGDVVGVDLGELDATLRARTDYPGLAAAVEAVTGRPLVDRQAQRQTEAARRDAPFRRLSAWLDETPAAEPEPWRAEWLAQSRPLVRRCADEAVLVKALRVVRALDGQASRTDLASRLLGNAHALDDGTPVGELVLRALAVRAGVGVPAGAEERRRLWADAGVVLDQVSATCLVLGLRPAGDSSAAQRLRLAAEAGDPAHLTAWDLGRCTMTHAVTAPVLVCENPRVLEAIAERHGGDFPVVCTSGNPNTVVLAVVERLASQKVPLRYHGDFDWPGIAIANRLVERFRIEPWRMGVDDYEPAARPDGPPLVGSPIEARWDPELAPAMHRRGVAVHEEAVLDDLLASMTGD